MRFNGLIVSGVFHIGLALVRAVYAIFVNDISSKTGCTCRKWSVKTCARLIAFGISAAAPTFRIPEEQELPGPGRGVDVPEFPLQDMPSPVLRFGVSFMASVSVRVVVGFTFNEYPRLGVFVSGVVVVVVVVTYKGVTTTTTPTFPGYSLDCR